MKYYDKDGNMNEQVFKDRLKELHNQVDGATLKQLLSIRSKLYRLKKKHEESGRRFLDCEYEIIALGEVIEEIRN